MKTHKQVAAQHIIETAQRLGSVKFRWEVADSFSSLAVNAEGAVKADGYAKFSYPQGVRLSELSWQELGGLLDACEEAGSPF